MALLPGQGDPSGKLHSAANTHLSAERDAHEKKQIKSCVSRNDCLKCDTLSAEGVWESLTPAIRVKVFKTASPEPSAYSLCPSPFSTKLCLSACKSLSLRPWVLRHTSVSQASQGTQTEIEMAAWRQNPQDGFNAPTGSGYFKGFTRFKDVCSQQTQHL